MKNANTLLFNNVYKGKKVRMKNFIIILMAVLMSSCNKTDDTNCGVIICYAFDIRQCETDQYAESVLESDSQELRESKMKSWLTDNDLPVTKVKLVIGYNLEVCEACHVCPMGDRYYIKMEEKDYTSKAEELELLNFQSVDCSGIF